MEIYIRKRQNTFAQYIVTRLIMDLCEAADRKRGAWVGIRWWEQAELYLEGEREMSLVAAEAEEDGLEE